MFSFVIFPEHSVCALPSISSTACLITSGVILSSMMISAPASTASLTCSRFSTSISILRTNGAYAFAICTAFVTLPAAPIWLSLRRTPSERLYLWLHPPPTLTAYFSNTRQFGVVLRVSRRVTLLPSRSLETCLV